MKRIILNLILATFAVSLHAQDANLINQSIDFVGVSFVIKDSNPMEESVSNSINDIFKEALQEYKNKGSDTANSKRITDIFKLLYENGGSFYSDTYDVRRFKLRRAGCFASVALLSDIDRGFTFIQYAKFAISDNTDSPSNIEFVETQYLGLLFIETIFKYKDNQLNKSDLKNIRKFINDNLTKINSGITARAINLLNDFEQNIKIE